MSLALAMREGARADEAKNSGFNLSTSSLFWEGREKPLLTIVHGGTRAEALPNEAFVSKL